MSIHRPDKAIAEAQRQINAVLSTLESATGSIVKNLSIDRIDMTNVSSERTEFLTTCVIEMERVPSQNWSV